MQSQKIERTIIARAQHRIILWLSCGHKISIGGLPERGDFTTEGDITEGAMWPCRHCDDPPEQLTISRRDMLRRNL